MNGEIDLALEYYRLCLQHRPSHSYCRLNLAALLPESSRSQRLPRFESSGEEEAEKELKTCLKQPVVTRNEIIGQKLCRFNLGRSHLKNGKPEEALKILQPLVEESAGEGLQGTQLKPKTKASLFNLYAEALFNSDQSDQAADWASKSLSENPNHQAAYETKSKICVKILSKDSHSQSKSWDECMENVRKMDYNRINHVIGILGNSEGLAKICQNAFFVGGIINGKLDQKINQTQTKILESCGEQSRKLGFYSQAFQYFNQLLDRLNDSSNESPNESSNDSSSKFLALANIAGIYHLESDFENAEKFYRKALEIRPNSHLVKANLEKLLNIKS